MNKTLKTFLILAGINILFDILGVILGMDGFAMLIVATLMIIISVVIVIGVFIAESYKKYLDRDSDGRKKSRKKAFIICGITAFVLIAGWIMLAFRGGYVMPQTDKQKDWGHFPKSSNPNVSIEPVDSLYIYTIERIKGTDHFLVSFAKDSLRFNTSNQEVLFGIIDERGNLKVQYDQTVDVYPDKDRVIVSETVYGDYPDTTYCDVYDSKTLALQKEIIHLITIPEKYDPYFSEVQKDAYIKKYRTAFFENLTGIENFQDKPIYAGSNKDRGFSLYKDEKGSLYQTRGSDDGYSLNILAPQSQGYTLEVSEFEAKTTSENIKMSRPPIIYKNNLSSGASIAYGKPNGGNDGLYFHYYQTWLMYYTATLGKTTTSFKVDGGEPDRAYVRFYQLNKVKNDSDTLYVVAQNRLWKIHKK